MGLANLGANLAEMGMVPDTAVRFGMRQLISASNDRFSRIESESDFTRSMSHYAIAERADAANAQHYELPPEFFATFLGPRRKYSCCLYADNTGSLAAAEDRALEETAQHTRLEDGQDVLELGCGWGSLSLWMAAHFPASRITAVSNSAPQRHYIEAQAQSRGLSNLKVITADMNDFSTDLSFDRIVSVEMFEHMTNWRALLTRARRWLRPDGNLFIHIFTHRSGAYHFDHRDKSDWIAQHFFTGGIMPSQRLIRKFSDLFEVEEEWRWSGTHYQRTAMDWLRNFDARRDEATAILHRVHGDDAPLMRRRWRMFFLATAEMFGFANGEAWGVSHYRLRRADSRN
jgi:cyclopropane-fatty-acyl-phospholipid synthase